MSEKTFISLVNKIDNGVNTFDCWRSSFDNHLMVRINNRILLSYGVYGLWIDTKTFKDYVDDREAIRKIITLLNA